MKLIYVDTSVFGGKFDKEFIQWTELFFKKIVESEIKIILSEVTEIELEKAPAKVRIFAESIPKRNLVKVALTPDAIILAEKYIREGVVGQTSLFDCYHIAIATILKADLLASWNFKHIVNINRIHGYNAVNMLNSYQILEIRNPREIFNYGN